MRLLLVEDDVMVASGVKLGLCNAGYTVDWVPSAERAERALTGRIAFERLVGRISSDLILAAPAELDRHLDQALGELGRFAEADRLHPRQNGVGAARHLETGLQDAVLEFGGVVQTMGVAVDGKHDGVPYRGR